MQHKFSKKQVTEQHQEQRQTAPSFESVEEMLRYDAHHTVPPPTLAERLGESLAREKPRSWWRRWFGGGEPL